MSLIIIDLFGLESQGFINPLDSFDDIGASLSHETHHHLCNPARGTDTLLLALRGSQTPWLLDGQERR